MTIYMEYMKQVCKDLTNKLGLNENNQHVAMIFKDNEHDQIIGWEILDENNNIIKQYGDIKELFIDNE